MGFATGQTVRRRPLRVVVATAIAALTALLLAACSAGGGSAASSAEGDRLHVVTTTTWHTDLARQIGGDLVTVEGLMEPGVDPHLYTATAGDVEALAEADIAIRNGLELEGKLDEVFEHVARTVPVVAVGEAVPVDRRIPIEGTGEFDPHIWFDPDNWAYAAEAVADGFSQADPDNADRYHANLEAFKRELAATRRAIENEMKAIPASSRVLVTSHDAFSYFGRAFGLEVAPIQGKSTASEATTSDIERVAALVAKNRLKAVFIESSVPEQTIDAVLASAERRGQRTALGGQLFGDSLGDLDSPAGTWSGALAANARTIVEGLGAR